MLTGDNGVGIQDSNPQSYSARSHVVNRGSPLYGRFLGYACKWTFLQQFLGMILSGRYMLTGGNTKGFQGSNPQSCSARPHVADKKGGGGLHGRLLCYSMKNLTMDHSV
jgi:hypothetical protein